MLQINKINFSHVEIALQEFRPSKEFVSEVIKRGAIQDVLINMDRQDKTQFKKMKILLPLFLLLCFSCNVENTDETESDQIVDNTSSESANKDANTTLTGWSKPELINASSFGQIINVYCKVGNYNELYRLTDQATRAKYSKKEIIKVYKNMAMGFEMGFPMNKTTEDGVVWLYYKVDINATKKILRMPILIENDTCRLVLNQFQQELERITETNN